MATYDVFISYSRKDTRIVNSICKAFDEVGIKYFIDRRGLSAGNHFPEQLADAIINSKLMLFVGSKNSYISSYTIREITFANDEKGSDFIIPYLIDNSQQPPGVRLLLSGVQRLTIHDTPIGSSLTNEILKRLGVAPPPPPPPPTNDRFGVFHYLHFAVFAPLLVVISSLFFFGLISIPAGRTAAYFNILLTLCLSGTLLCSYWTAFKRKKLSFLILCLLSVLEIFLVCIISWYVYDFAASKNWSYTNKLYVLLNGLGWKMHNKPFSTIALMEIFALLHVGLVCVAMFVRIKGKTLWEELH